MNSFEKRRRRLLSAAKGFDGVVVTDPKNLFYLTDFWGGGIGVVKEDRTILLTSFMEEKRANLDGKEVEVIATSARGQQLEGARRLARGKVLSDELEEGLGKTTVDPQVFLHVRRKKDEEEISRIAAASRRIEKLYKMLEVTMKPGMTERQVAARVMELATEEKLSPLPAEGSLDPVIVGSGENGAFPHAEVSDRRLRVGDLVVADIFFRFRGYCSDCTRTFAIGRASQQAKEAYQAVLEAQLAGVKLVSKGASGRSIHQQVKAVLAERKLGDYFTHGTGHGVGIDIHESPSLGQSSTDRLREGDVVTIEPGVYLPGKFGIRIEDTLALGEKTKNLYSYTKELLVLG